MLMLGTNSPDLRYQFWLTHGTNKGGHSLALVRSETLAAKMTPLYTTRMSKTS